METAENLPEQMGDQTSCVFSLDCTAHANRMPQIHPPIFKRQTKKSNPHTEPSIKYSEASSTGDFCANF